MFLQEISLIIANSKSLVKWCQAVQSAIRKKGINNVNCSVHRFFLICQEKQTLICDHGELSTGNRNSVNRSVNTNKFKDCMMCIV